jgi:hypothetical protein
VRQVGHLQELYRDARSTEHEILANLIIFKFNVLLAVHRAISV